MKKSLLWIGDVDGVFTDHLANPSEEAILLSAGIGAREPFGYVTGRAEAWLSRHLLPTLTKAYEQAPPRLGLVCAEYGGVILRWENGQWSKERNPHFLTVGEGVRAELRARIAKIPGVFFDGEKEVMISVEAQHNLRATDHELVEEGLRLAGDLLQKYAQSRPGLEYQRTTYACDLVPKGMNKAYGAAYILAHLVSPPEHVHLLGDAPSDLGLADPMRTKKIFYTMHFVGESAAITSALRKEYVIEESSKKYAAGTVQILQEFL